MRGKLNLVSEYSRKRSRRSGYSVCLINRMSDTEVRCMNMLAKTWRKRMLQYIEYVGKNTTVIAVKPSTEVCEGYYLKLDEW